MNEELYQYYLDILPYRYSTPYREYYRLPYEAYGELVDYTGNVDLSKRPMVQLPSGEIATVRSMSFNDGAKEVLIPTVSADGKLFNTDEAIANYYDSGMHLGKFNTVEEANDFAEKLHKQQEEYYGR